MQKRLARMICFAMSALFLWGCGKESDESEVQSTGTEDETAVVGSETEEGHWELPEGYALSPRFEYAGGETEMREICMAENSIYYYTHTYNSETESYEDNSYVQKKGQEEQQLPFGEEKAVMGMAAGQDGCMYFLWGENYTDDGYGSFTLEKRDSQMEQVYSVDATEGMEGLSRLYDMAAAPDGKLYGLTTRGIVLCWDENGEYQGRFTLPVDLSTAEGNKICYGLANAGEKGIYAFWKGKEVGAEKGIRLYELSKLQKMSEAELEQAEPLRVDYASAEETVATGGDLFIFSGYSDGLYMVDQNRMWQIDLTDGSLEALFQWQDMNIKAEYVQAVSRQGDGFLLYVFDTLESGNYWLTLEAVPASQISEKKELVLGIAGTVWYDDSLASKIDQVVMAYNRIHPECHITVKEYEEKSVPDFQLEILKGEGPDIFLERQSFFNMDELAAKGAVEDLMPYLADAEEVSAEDILPGILDLITKNGKISRIPLSFAVDVVILPEDIQQEVMTPQEMVEFIMQGEDVCIDFSMYSQRDFLLQILSGAEMDHYIDENSRSSSFAGKEFVRLLETLDKLRDLNFVRKRGERAELFHAGRLRAVVEEMNCLDDYFCIRSAFSGKGKIAGFPNSAGELCYPAKLYDWLGINSASEHKEEAWGFVEFCLSYTSRSDNFTDRFVVTKDKFQQQISYEESGSHFIWRNDYDENFEGWQEIASVTPEETELLREMTEHLYFYENKNLFEIISEEASAFFAGGISSQEAAELIQNRANLVLGE